MPARVDVPTRLVMAAALVALLLLVAGCNQDAGGNVDPDQVDAMTPGSVGDCRVLTPKDVAEPTNATRTVGCDKPHTAETYAVGTLPDSLASVSYDDERLGAFAYQTCGSAFQSFLGADESLAMRTVLSWAWFRPSQKAWDKGARWYRCDVVGGGDESKGYVDLPPTAKGLLAGGRPPDRWLVCVNGASVQAAPKIPCSQRHTWRAVATVKLGEPGDPYPGDHVVEVKTKEYCSQQVGAWLGYPPDYDFGYTWFHEGEWKAGNRRSVCWARTTA